MDREAVRANGGIQPIHAQVSLIRSTEEADSQRQLISPTSPQQASASGILSTDTGNVVSGNTPRARQPPIVSSASGRDHGPAPSSQQLPSGTGARETLASPSSSNMSTGPNHPQYQQQQQQQQQQPHEYASEAGHDSASAASNARVGDVNTEVLAQFATYLGNHFNTFSQRAEKVLRRPLLVDLDVDSFRTSRDLNVAARVIIEKALDRIIGAIEWFCEWPSCQNTLSHRLAGVRLVCHPERSHSFIQVGSDSVALAFADTFAANDGFTSANTIAHVMDEHFELFKLRVHDIRFTIMPPYETRIRKVLGNRCDLRLNIENFGRLDWEEDKFYNTYLELAPRNADAFFGRVVKAIERCCQTATGYKKCHDSIQIVEIKLSLKAYKRLHLKSRRLKLSERFWNGIEHDRTAIQAYLSEVLHLGTDVSQRVQDIATLTVPYWEERLRRTLGLTFAKRIVIDIEWPSFRQASAFEKAIDTLETRRSAYVLERVWGAVQDIVDTYPPAAVTMLRDTLARVHIRQWSTTDDHDLDQQGRSSCAVLPLSEGTVSLEIKASFELGREACFSQDFIRKTLVKALGFDAQRTLAGVDVQQIRQTHHSVEVHGHITDSDTFHRMFNMMAQYQQSVRQIGSSPHWG